jgi:polyvinyl alcohol dehydrogenase (cytochrome)
MRAHARALTAAAVAALALACTPVAGAATKPCSAPVPAGGDWPTYGHDVANTRTQPVEAVLTPARVAGLRPAWTFAVPTTGSEPPLDGTALQSTPIVAGGCVFVGSGDGVAYAVDARSGREVWHTKLDAPTPGLGGALVGAPAVAGKALVYLVNQTDTPYAVALDRSDGRVLWRSDPITTVPGNFTNASTVVMNGVVFAGYSEAETDYTKNSGGFALIDAETGAILKATPTIPPADQEKGYAGGGIWATAAYDPATGYAYVGTANPSSRTLEHEYTNAIVKIDVDRARPTFGEIVASYKGNPDQYYAELEALRDTPACAASDQPGVTYIYDDPACGQLDLDFGAPPNLFDDGHGRLLVGELQKSGVYHAVRADTMEGAWMSLVGGTCAYCNAGATAFDGSSVIGVFAPGGVMEALAPGDGSVRWRAPIADVVHYQGTTTAAGVAYTVDNGGNLDAFDAATGAPLLHRPMALDTGTLMIRPTSGGVAIADHAVFAAGTATGGGGYLLAYRLPG